MEPFEERYWNLVQVLAWVVTGDRRLVRKAAGDAVDTGTYMAEVELPDGQRELAELTSHGFGPRHLDITVAVRGGGALKNVEEGEAVLIRALEYGRVKCLARRYGEGGLQPIPEIQWPGLRFEYGPTRAIPRGLGSDGAAHWSDLKFERDDVLKEWPDPLEKVLTDPETGATPEELEAQTKEPESQQAVEIEPAEETPEAVPSGLTADTRSKGGSHSKQNRWLLEAFQRIADMLTDDGIQPTSPAIWNWVCDNAQSNAPHEFDPIIPGCDLLYVDGDELIFTDQEGNRKSRTRRSLERYRPRPKTHQG